MTPRIDRRTLLLAGLGVVGAACTTSTSGVVPVDRDPVPDDTEPPVVPEAEAASPSPTDLVMIGDSITVMSTNDLLTVLPASGLAVDAIDAQVGRRMNVGTRGGLLAGRDVVEFVAASDPPGLWVVALGANDVGQYPDEAAYAEQIATFLDAVPAGAPLVWIDAWHADEREHTEMFNAVVREALDRRDRSLVGAWSARGEDEGVITGDGVHPTRRGMQVFADVTLDAVTELLDQL